MLNVDHTHNAPAAENRNGEKRLELILRQFAEKAKSRVTRGAFGYRHRFTVFRYPAANSLSNANLQPVYGLGMRVLRSTQYQLIIFQHLHKTGVALHQGGYESDDAVKDVMQRIRSYHPAANFMQEIDSKTLARGHLHLQHQITGHV
jgi:hypothetical protein